MQRNHKPQILKQFLAASAALLVAGGAFAQASAPAAPAAPAGKPGMGQHHHHGGGMWMKSIDTDGDGAISKAEADAWFNKLDTNHDGKIDPKEIASSPPLMERNLRTAERMAKQWDANGDGIVTRAEFDASAKERFDKQDKDKTGKLARKPMPTMNQMPGVQMPGVKPGTMPPIKPVPPQPATPDPAPKPKN